MGQHRVEDFQFNTANTYRIFLEDGSVVVGEFVAKTTDLLVLSSSSIPRIEIPIANIIRVEVVAPENLKHRGEYWFPNPNPTRYLFSPTAFNLKKGQGYYQNSYLVFNSINYGLTDFISLGGGFELTSMFSPDVTPLVFLSPKIGTTIRPDLHAGGGLLFVQVEDYSFGILYGTGTYGNEDQNLTTSMGWGFFEGEFSARPIITVSGIKRVRRNLSLLSENWFTPKSDTGYYRFFSYGVRFFGEKMAVDLAFINNADIIEVIRIGIPYVDFVIKF